MEKLKKDVIALDIRATADHLALDIERTIPSMRNRLKKFVRAFLKEFPSGKNPKDLQRRVGAEALTWAPMDGPLALYALGMNGSAITELHAILERFVLRDLSQYLAASPSKKTIIGRLIERQSLPELAIVLCDLDVWNKNDVKFARELTKLRNGIAHKNPRIISNVLLSGRRISILDIDSSLRHIDVIHYLIHSISLLYKLSTSLQRHK